MAELIIYALKFNGRDTKVFPHEIGLIYQCGLISARKEGLECVFNPDGDLTPSQKATLQHAGFGYELLTPVKGGVQ